MPLYASVPAAPLRIAGLGYALTMNTSIGALGWRSLWRDARAGELRLLVLAVTLAVAALTAVAFFADRLNAGLQRDARQLLGGDAVVLSDHPPPTQFVQQASALGLQQALTLAFPTMARADDAQGGQTRLVALKAVAPGYPLRGQLRTRGTGQALLPPDRAVPQTGEVWADPALGEALALRLGDPLWLGERRFVIARWLVLEPDRGLGFMNFAPRVMMNQADLDATGLVQPASRISYRMAVAGDETAVQAFVDWAQAQIASHAVRGVRLDALQGGRPELGSTLNRAEKFLRLVALLAALLSAVAVALAARNFAQRRLDDCALLRVLGLRQRQIAGAYALEFLGVGVVASALGVGLGYALHGVFAWLLRGLVDVALPSAGWAPVGLGLGVGLTLLLAFGLPPVLQLAQVPPLRVIRRDLGGLRPASAGVLGVALLGFVALLLAASQDVRLGLWVVGGFALAALGFAAVATVAVQALRGLIRERTAAPAWVLATRQMAARPAYTVLQVTSLGLGLLALVLLVLLRTDLLASWRAATPAQAPNRFVINVMPDQADDFTQALRAAGVLQFDWFPMIRGRLVAINDQPVAPDDFASERARRLVDREFNLSNAAQMPQHNTVVAGRWTPNEAGAVSVEEGIAQTLGLKLGDVLQFDVGGVPLQGRITSLRKVNWGSLRANFFVMFPTASLGDVPTTFMSAFRAPETAGFDAALVRRFPNITSVNTSDTLAQVQHLLDQVSRAVELLFGFALAAGLVVLVASVGATREQRTREFAVMRALGARARLLRQVQSLELLGVGALAGTLATAAAVAVAGSLARYVFEFPLNVSWWLALAGPTAGAALAWLAGWWSLREVLARPVVQTLREAAA
ncbi:MAG: FtsX-like permease family protein [Rhodoferax sp.]